MKSIIIPYELLYKKLSDDINPSDASSIKQLQDTGYKLYLSMNEKTLSEKAMKYLLSLAKSELHDYGVSVSKCICTPKNKTVSYNYRKLINRYGLDKSKLYVLCSNESDASLSEKLGLNTILVQDYSNPEYTTCKSLSNAIKLILMQEEL